MSELRVPLDVEQLAEVCQLRSLLRSNSVVTAPAPRQIEALAAFMVLRLFIVLGYLARSTNKPGRLTPAGAMQLRESLEPLFGENCDPVQLLVQAGLLVPLPSSSDGWECQAFARINEHLAGDYRPKHIRGNDMRQVGIAINAAATAAPHQAMILLPEVCRRVLPDGTKVAFDPQELDRVMLLIGTIDRMFRFTRQRTQFTEPLLNAAWVACNKCGYTTRVVPESLRQFLGWLITHRDSPRVPKTTDELLADFETIFALANGTP